MWIRKTQTQTTLLPFSLIDEFLAACAQVTIHDVVLMLIYAHPLSYPQSICLTNHETTNHEPYDRGLAGYRMIRIAPCLNSS